MTGSELCFIIAMDTLFLCSWLDCDGTVDSEGVASVVAVCCLSPNQRVGLLGMYAIDDFRGDVTCAMVAMDTFGFGGLLNVGAASDSPSTLRNGKRSDDICR